MAPDSASDIKTRILEAALGLLAVHGVTELTQPKVAKAAGVRQSHLTYYFRTRSDLLKAVASHSLQSMLAALGNRAAEGSLNPQTFAQLAGEMVGDKRRARVMLGLIVASDGDREIKQFLREFIDRVRDGLAALTRMLGKQVDAPRVAAFHALMVGTAVLNVARDNDASRKDCARLAQFAIEQVLLSESAALAAAVGKAKRGAK